ncbi:hypothetical protein BV20DRAFT_962092 [Pilatotrama ljubarskyi]|nr:hypothetical protein BV20DRAFT_962092 [Pilatotrama ljubarskyi]
MDSFMERLPEELVAYIFDHLQAAHALSTAMVVNRQWYMFGARNLHSRLVLGLGFDLTLESSETVVCLMKRLVSPTLPSAHLIRHLVIYGLARPDVQSLILDILRRATGLRSLDMHSLHCLHSESLFPPDAVSAQDLLPSIVALNVASAPFIAALAHTRRLHALRVHDPMDHAALSRLAHENGNFVNTIQSLELAVSIDSPGAAVEEMAYLASALRNAPLRALALQFVLGRPGLMSWSDFEDVIGRMGPLLRTFPDLSIVSLVIRPDPIMPSIASGEVGSGEEQRERMTRRLAERLIADNSLTRLTRIELRWHGWTVHGGALSALSRSEFLRLPQNWTYQQHAASVH